MSPSPVPVEDFVVDGNFALGQTARFKYFDVTVHEKRFAPNGVEGGGLYGVRVSVCYTAKHPEANEDGSTRTSADPWDFGWSHGPDPVWELDRSQLSGHWSPAYAERPLKVGQCNRGWLSVDLREAAFAAHVGARYAPSNFTFSGTWTW